MLIVDKNTVVVDDTLLAEDAGGAAAGDAASGYAPVADTGAPSAASNSTDDTAAAAPSGSSADERMAADSTGVAPGAEAAASPSSGARVVGAFVAISGGAVVASGDTPPTGVVPGASGSAVTPGAQTAATPDAHVAATSDGTAANGSVGATANEGGGAAANGSSGAVTEGSGVTPAASVTDDNATTAPAVKSLSLDADELLFGKKGAKLKLNAKLRPGNAYTGDMKYESSDESVAVVTSDGAVRAKGWGTCVITLKSGSKKAKCKVTVAKKWVALTFDDGPGRYTDKLLKAMKKQDVRATFFIVGQMAKPRASILKKIEKNGSEIANHTYAHNGTEGALMNGLKKTDKIVKKATGRNTVLMRPPGGAINSVTRRCGKPIILWSVDPKDWRDRNANTVYNRVMDGTRSGGIVLLHDIHPTSVDAAIRIMKSLKEKGYAFVTVSELLDNPAANKVYNKGSKKVRTMKIKY
jgi:peptidoglycan/xylan/chitin deacetylase (PgdA/CDA1 family)